MRPTTAILPMPEDHGPPPELNRRQVTVWALYDFANSVYPAVIQTAVFGAFFASAIVGNEDGRGDFWWGLAVSTSVLLVALTSPPLGNVADRAGVRKRLMMGYTALCVSAVFLFFTIEPGMVMWGFCLIVLANFGYEGALVFYNAYLPDIAPREKQGLVSGIGFGTGYAGSIVGLLVALPLVTRGQYDLTWMAVAVMFAVFSVPTFLGLPADKPGERSFGQAAAEGITNFKHILGDVLRRKNLRRFLLAYFIYIDGVNTTIVVASLFAMTTLGFERPELIQLFLVVQVSALGGAFALAKPTDVWGPKRVITLTLFLWTSIAFAAYFVQTKAMFVAIAFMAGTGLGAIQAASRALMASLIPEGKESEMFGFYAFCGKSSSVIGPTLFGWISLVSNQRVAVLAIAVFFVAGLALLQRVEDPKGVGAHSGQSPA